MAEEAVAIEAVPLTVRGRGGLAATCCAVMFLYAVYFGAISVLLPFLGASFGLGAEVQGRLFPADFLGFILGVLACGALSDRLGRKTVLLMGIAAFALGLALFSHAPSFGMALLATALIGGGTGTMETVASALASDLFPERRAFIINAIQVAFGAGAAFSPSLAHRLLTMGTDWRPLYLGLSIANIVLFLALAVQRVPRAMQGGEALDFAALRRVLKQPAFLALCLAQGLYVGAETGFFSWMPTYFKERLPNGAAWEGLVVTVFWIAITIGRITTGALVERMPLMRLTLLLAGGGAVCSALALVWQMPLLVMVFVFLTGLCFSGIFGLLLAETGERFPAVAGTAFGGVVAAGGVGGAIVPWLVGALSVTALDWRGALLVVPCVAAGIAVLALRVERKGSEA